MASVERVSSSGSHADLSSDGWRDVDSGAVGEYADRLRFAARRTGVARGEVADLLGVLPGEVVLDIGCGIGDVLVRFSEALVRVGLDRSHGLLRSARDSGALVVQGDGVRLPFRSGSVDAVHIARVLLHMDEPELVVRECALLLAPGGRVVVLEPDWQSFRLDAHDHELNAFIEATFRAGVRQPAVGRHLTDMLQNAGLRVTACDILPVRKVGPEEVDPQGIVKPLLDSAHARGEVGASAVRAWDTAWASSDSTVVATSLVFRVAALRD